MPDNRKPLEYGAFPVYRNYTVKAQLCQPADRYGMVAQGCAGMAGHSDIQMTANIYSHLDVGRKASIAASLSERLKL